jgi:hypothetical protein
LNIPESNLQNLLSKMEIGVITAVGKSLNSKTISD